MFDVLRSERFWVWVVRLAVVLTAILIGLIPAPAPKLVEWMGSEGWARLATILLAVFGIRFSLVLLGIFGGKMEFLGISIETGDADMDKDVEARLLMHIGAVAGKVEQALERISALEERLRES